LALLGSYVDGRDFIDPEQAQQIARFGCCAARLLIKARSPERDLTLIPPAEPIIDPFNPAGRLLMLRTDLLDTVPLSTPDHELYQGARAVGYRAGIATDVRHCHLSLINLFDYPAYYASANANRSPTAANTSSGSQFDAVAAAGAMAAGTS
jgi:hypothetical protein